MGGLLSYLPNYSMEDHTGAGYYHIYLIIVWRPHSGRVIIIYLIIVWRPHRGGLLSYLPNYSMETPQGRVIIIFT